MSLVYRQQVPIFAEAYPKALEPAFEQLRAFESEAAYAAFQAYLGQHPNDEHAYEGAIVALLQQTRWNEAEQLTAQARTACPHSRVLKARQTWNWVYLTRESEAYPLVIELLEQGYHHTDWLREVVLPLRNVLICHASDPRLAPCRKRDRQRQHATLLKGIQTLEHWLERYQFPIPDEPVGVKISLNIIACNEAKYLEACLQSVQGVVDEIVLVDTGSTDATVQIAERFGAKVIRTEWHHDFSEARNLALQHSTGDWIFVLDADERLMPDSKNAILNAVRHPQFAAYHLEILNEIREGDYFVHRLVRLFRRLPYLRWEGAIHEQIVPSIATQGGRLATISARILHLGYRPELMQQRDKIQRNLALIQRALEHNPDDLFQKFNLANTYFSAEDYAQAVSWAEQTCPYLRGDEDYAGQAWAIWIGSLLRMNQLEEALRVGADALARRIDHPMVHYTLATVYFHMGFYQKALEALEAVREAAVRMQVLTPDGEAIQVGSPYVGDIGVVGHKWLYLRAKCLQALGRLDEAAASLERLLQMRPNDAMALLEYGQVLAQQGALEAAERAYLRAASQAEYAPAAQQLLAKLWWDAGDYGRAVPYLRAIAQALPNEPEWWERWLHAAQESHQWRGVVEAYEFRAAQGDPITAPMHINWGRALWRLHRYEEALEHFTRAIELDPGDANAFLNAGDALYQLGAYAQAADAYAAGIERDPYNAQAWFTLGNSYFRMGVYDAAKIAYERALALDPSHEHARHNLELTNERIRTTAA